MGVWGEQVLPRVINVALDAGEVRAMRTRICAGLHGDVVEIGFGSGLSVPAYPPSVTGVWAVEPSRVARRLAARRVAASPVPVTLAGLDGQSLDLPSDRFDAALSAFTLCTVPDPAAALRELRRVLRPGAALHVLEHGRAPDPRVARWQDRVQPVHGRLAGGCRLDRDIVSVVTGAGFRFERLDNYYAQGPRPWGYITEGVARSGDA
jgi:ubiquinone/menaquinone biosynthesis C-methylase UbiE